jgi:hypothetical protein
LIGCMIAADAIPPNASSKVGLSEARSGLAGILLREERSEHATKFRETTF